jgi:hypothetical protein
MALFDASGLGRRSPGNRAPPPIGFGGKKNIDKPSRVKAFCEKLFASGGLCPPPWRLAYQMGRLL